MVVKETVVVVEAAVEGAVAKMVMAAAAGAMVEADQAERAWEAVQPAWAGAAAGVVVGVVAEGVMGTVEGWRDEEMEATWASVREAGWAVVLLGVDLESAVSEAGGAEVGAMALESN
jgi:hypothetical protein